MSAIRLVSHTLRMQVKVINNTSCDAKTQRSLYHLKPGKDLSQRHTRGIRCVAVALASRLCEPGQFQLAQVSYFLNNMVSQTHIQLEVLRLPGLCTP